MFLISKKLFIYALLSVTTFSNFGAMLMTKVPLTKPAHFSPLRPTVVKTTDGLAVNLNGKYQRVAQHNIDPMMNKLQHIDPILWKDKIGIKVGVNDHGEATLKTFALGKGGGLGGAAVGGFIGYWGTKVVGVVTIVVTEKVIDAYTFGVGGKIGMRIVAPGAWAAVEAAAIKGALWGSITGGTLTGPA